MTTYLTIKDIVKKLLMRINHARRIVLPPDIIKIRDTAEPGYFENWAPAWPGLECV